MPAPKPIPPEKITPPDELMELQDWWQKNGNTVSTVMFVVAVAILGSFVVRLWQGHREKVADQASYDAANARTIEAFEKVAADYPSTGDAPVALLKSATMYCQSGKTSDYGLANDKYKEFLSRYPKHALAPVARLGVAFTAEAQGEYADAAAIYREHLAAHGVPDILSEETDGDAKDSLGDGDYLNPVALLGLGRCLVLQGDKSSARTIFDQISAGYANTTWGELALTASEHLDRIKGTTTDDLLDQALGTAPTVAPTTEAAPAAESAPAAEAPADAPSDAPADAPAAE